MNKSFTNVFESATIYKLKEGSFQKSSNNDDHTVICISTAASGCQQLTTQVKSHTQSYVWCCCYAALNLNLNLSNRTLVDDSSTLSTFDFEPFGGVGSSMQAADGFYIHSVGIK
jgi:hypothetical protein